MKEQNEIIAIAKKALQNEAEAILKLQTAINESFYGAVKSIYHASGRVVITGIGKSAIIANKIVATMNSTGTPALFMHAADAIHGDLGMIQQDDVIICISKSGNTPEIKVLIPLLKQSKNTLIAIVGNVESYLAKQSDFILDTTIAEEACPNNLAPMTSTTVALAIGDALSACLIKLNKFTPADFSKYHPLGQLGKNLTLKVEDIMHKGNKLPFVTESAMLKEAIIEISNKGLGIVCIYTFTYWPIYSRSIC